MNVLLLIAHAPLASALRQGVLHVFPDAGAQVAAVDVAADAAPDVTLAQARAALQALRAAQPAASADAADTGALLLADMLGATPCNVAQRLLAEPGTLLLAGANLPMALRAYSYRHEPLPGMAARAQAGGAQAVVAVDPLPAGAAG